MTTPTPISEALAAEVAGQDSEQGLRPVGDRQASSVMMVDGRVTSATLGDDGGVKILVNRITDGKTRIRIEAPG